MQARKRGDFSALLGGIPRKPAPPRRLSVLNAAVAAPAQEGHRPAPPPQPHSAPPAGNRIPLTARPFGQANTSELPPLKNSPNRRTFQAFAPSPKRQPNTSRVHREDHELTQNGLHDQMPPQETHVQNEGLDGGPIAQRRSPQPPPPQPPANDRGRAAGKSNPRAQQHKHKRGTSENPRVPQATGNPYESGPIGKRQEAFMTAYGGAYPLQGTAIRKRRAMRKNKEAAWAATVGDPGWNPEEDTGEENADTGVGISERRRSSGPLSALMLAMNDVHECEEEKRGDLERRQAAAWQDLRHLASLEIAEAMHREHQRTREHRQQNNALFDMEGRLRLLVENEEEDDWITIREEASSGLQVATERTTVRATFETDEQAIILREEAAWRREDVARERKEREEIVSTCHIGARALHDWCIRRAGLMQRLTAAETMQRTAIEHALEIASRALRLQYAEEAETAQLKAARREVRVWYDTQERKFSADVDQLVGEEAVGRNAILDEQLAALLRLSGAQVQMRTEALKANKSRIEAHRARREAMSNQEGTGRRDIAGAEEQERFRLQFVQQREERRLLSIVQYSERLIRLEETESAARVVFETEMAKAWEELVAKRDAAEDRLLSALNPQLLAKVRVRRFRAALQDVVSSEGRDRLQVVWLHKCAWQRLMYSHEAVALQEEERRIRREMIEEEVGAWLDFRREKLGDAVTMLDEARWGKLMTALDITEMHGRRAIEGDEKEKSRDLQMVYCQMIVQENRRRIARRRECNTDAPSPLASSA